MVARFFFCRSLVFLFLVALLSSVRPAAQVLQWEQHQGYRSAVLNVPKEGKAGFSRMGTETGVIFSNIVSVSRYTTNQIYLNGSGVAAGDVDNDGLTDLFFANIEGPNALYKNLGNWRFQEIAAAAGVAFPELDCTGAVLADLDGDADLDLVVNTVGQGTCLLFNDGKGKFAPPAKFNEGKGGMSLTLTDTDGDGDLDIYITNYRTSTIRDDPTAKITGEYVNGRPVPSKYNGRPVTEPDLQGRFTFGPTGKIIENGELDVFLRNDGSGKFTAVPLTELFQEEEGRPLQTYPYDWGLSCMFHDMNGDGAPDLYVCNDFESPDRIWINDGKGKFRAASWRSVRHTSMFSMGVDFADINRDGHFDFFVADMLSRSHESRQVQTGEVPPYMHHPGQVEDRPSYSHNTLFLNRGDASFAEISWFAHVEASEWTWTPAFLDVDLDGYEDLLVTTGHQLEMMNGDVIEAADKRKNSRQMSRMELLGLRHMFARFNVPNVAFRNRGDLTFEDVSEQWGFAEEAVSHGLAFADLDNDGDLDVAVNNLNSAASLYRNNSAEPRIGVRLKSASSKNTRGIGAKITLLTDELKQAQELISGGRYLSSDDPVRVFAARGSGPFRLEVKWRSGNQTLRTNLAPNRVYEISDESAETVPAITEARPVPMFEEVPLQPTHLHADEFYDDFQRQMLLPMRLSQLGPGATWHDYDDDGWDDLVLPSGRSGRLAIYKNNQGNLAPLAEPLLQRQGARDQTTALGFGAVLLIGSSNYEDGLTNGGWTRIYDLQRKASGENVLGPEAGAGPLASADVDGDGALDVFIGGRAKAGKYPVPIPSLLLRNENSRFVVKQRFDDAGLVSGAVFSDLDQDNDPDLLLACHWGGLRLFRNEKGGFKDATAEVGLEGQDGLWNSIATGDFNNDGQIDFVAGNWGLNTRFAASVEAPLKLYYADFDANGVMDMVEARFDKAMKKEVPLRGYRLMTMGIPSIQEKFPTRETFGKIGMPEIIAAYNAKPASCQVTELRSMLFLNQGGKFVATPLPLEAQLSPAFGLAVADYNGDGDEDVFISQNFFATSLEMPRSDAGLGLLLLGNGKGGFQPQKSQNSGISAYGEQRGAAWSDYNHDGRVDLVVMQNAAPTRIYKNVSATPGLRVRLRGPELNRSGIGAKIRLRSGGAIREVQSGSGYWSQNSTVQLFSVGPGGAEIVVTWPDGKQSTVAVPPAAREVVIPAVGSAQVIK